MTISTNSNYSAFQALQGLETVARGLTARSALNAAGLSFQPTAGADAQAAGGGSPTPATLANIFNNDLLGFFTTLQSGGAAATASSGASALSTTSTSSVATTSAASTPLVQGFDDLDKALSELESAIQNNPQIASSLSGAHSISDVITALESASSTASGSAGVLSGGVTDLTSAIDEINSALQGSAAPSSSNLQQALTQLNSTFASYGPTGGDARTFAGARHHHGADPTDPTDQTDQTDVLASAGGAAASTSSSSGGAGVGAFAASSAFSATRSASHRRG